MLSRDQLIAYFQDRLGVDTSSLGDNDPLFSSGLVDSFLLVELMMYLEEVTGRRIKPSDLTLENIDTFERILAFCSAD